jgi:Mg-chelatase subunit ChlD
MPEPTRVETGSAALEILLDVSGSMLALADAALAPSDLPNARRKDIADRTAIQLIQKRAGDCVGVTLFAKTTARLDAARNDPTALIQMIRGQPNRAIDGGASDLMLGLGEALSALGETHAESKQLVVLTDGDVNDETGEASNPVDVARSMGVHIVVLQIGLIEDTKVVAGVDLFNVPHFEPMHVAINHVLLVRVTKGSGGERIIASDDASLKSAIERLGKRGAP